MRRLSFKIYHLKFLASKLSITAVVLAFFVVTGFTAHGYPIENFSGVGLNEANTLSQSIKRTIKSLVQIELFKAFAQGQGGVNSGFSTNSQINWVNLKNLSGNDLSGAMKAVAILFLQIIITILGVTVGILKVILELVTNNKVQI